jgi:hypothetical protein
MQRVLDARNDAAKARAVAQEELDKIENAKKEYAARCAELQIQGDAIDKEIEKWSRSVVVCEYA